MIRNNKLILFDDGVNKDVNLPKYKKVESNDNSLTTSGFSGQFPTEGNNTITFNLAAQNRKNVLDSMKYEYSITGKLSLKLKIWLFKNIIYRNKLELKPISPKDLTEFFASIKDNITNLDKKHIGEVINSYEQTLLNAKDNHQTALVQKIENYASVLKHELLLSTTKFNKYLTEEQIVKFYRKASQHDKFKTKLCLTYVKNFAKIIPEEITALKKEADSLNVFDNYVVLHYDYDNSAVMETAEEIAKRKDPILFGVIIDSNRLYYIGDWIDDYCDLTLDAIIKKIGEKAKTINSASLKKDIQKI